MKMMFGRVDGRPRPRRAKGVSWLCWGAGNITAGLLIRPDEPYGAPAVDAKAPRQPRKKLGAHDGVTRVSKDLHRAMVDQHPNRPISSPRHHEEPDRQVDQRGRTIERNLVTGRLDGDAGPSQPRMSSRNSAVVMVRASA